MLFTLASVMATAAPIAAGPPVAALPSAIELAFALWRACRMRSPPALTLMLLGTEAREVALAAVTAIAAATLTGPLEVVALGVEPAPPDDAPPPEDATKSARPRSPATWPSTPPPGAPGAL